MHNVERLYCKRPILCLASSKILIPHPPHRPARVYPPPLVRGEDTLAGSRGGWGVNTLEDARHSSVLYICKYFVVHSYFFVAAPQTDPERFLQCKITRGGGGGGGGGGVC